MLIKSKSDVQYQHKRRKLDVKVHIGFLVDYKLTNIYWVWIPIKEKVVLVREIIFDKDEVWDGKPIPYSDNDIRELDKAIKYIKVPELEVNKMENIQLGKDSEIDMAIITITYQAGHKAEDFDINHENQEKQVNHNNQQWVQQQYCTPNPSLLEFFLANSVSISV